LSVFTVKRFQEPKEERRPWRIWFYDTSKQAIGALFIHFANVFLSGHTAEDPCSLYLMNFILDATLGMLLIWFGVKVVSWLVEHRKYTCLAFGEYGDPPQAAAWIGQCILYLLIMVFEKTVVSLALFIPGWTKLQEILLDYIPDPQLELVLVMFIVPFTVNAVMFWLVDSLIMRKYKQKDSLEGSRSIENPVRNEESQVSPENVLWADVHRQPILSRTPLIVTAVGGNDTRCCSVLTWILISLKVTKTSQDSKEQARKRHSQAIKGYFNSDVKLSQMERVPTKKPAVETILENWTLI
ncbi:hypothetical protein UY3_03951, partial [Chelonia mydas]